MNFTQLRVEYKEFDRLIISNQLGGMTRNRKY